MKFFLSMKLHYLTLCILLCYITVLGNQASFTASVTQGTAPLSVKFTNTSTTDIGDSATYKWKFQNKKSSTAKTSTTQTFAYPGIYKVVLKAYYSTDTSEFTSNITVYPPDTLYTLPFTENFNDTVVPPKYWSMYQTDQTQIGKFNYGEIFKLEGDYSIRTEPNTKFYGYIGNRLVSPKIKLAAIGNTLKFYAYQSTEPDYKSTVDVLISNSNAVNLNSFVLLRRIYETEVGFEDFTPIEINLDEFANQEIYVALQINNYAEGEPWYFDKFEVTENKKTVYSKFNVSPLYGTAPLTVNLINNSVGTLNNIKWYMGDGTVYNHAVTNHTYNTSGNYSISLVVGDGINTDSVRFNTPINVSENTVTVTAKAVASVNEGKAPLQVFFLNQSVNASNYIWDFGDNQTSNDADPNHTYQTQGNYIVTLIAYNQYSSDTFTLQQQINVTSAIALPQINAPIIYPNPATNILNIQNCPQSISIINMQGKVIEIFNNFNSKPLVQLNIAHLLSGLYILKSSNNPNFSTFIVIY